MPEGDTIHRVTAVLSRELTGRTLDRLELRGAAEIRELAGSRVEAVEAHGKHMFVHLDAGWSVRVHLGMHGTWRRQHAKERRPRAPTVLMVAGDVAWVCTRAYRAETVRTQALRTHPRLARLGPDLLADPPDIDGAMRRARLPAHAGREIGDALMDQRIAAGIGNVYKSEVLFEVRVHPRARVRDLDDATLAALFETAARLMRANLKTRQRETVPLRRRPHAGSRRHWVYMRGGRPCLECGTPIRRFLQGDMGRSTYWCPACQGASDLP